MIIGTILVVSSFSLGQIIVGRLVVGFAEGMLSATVPVWQASQPGNALSHCSGITSSPSYGSHTFCFPALHRLQAVALPARFTRGWSRSYGEIALMTNTKRYILRC